MVVSACASVCMCVCLPSHKRSGSFPAMLMNKDDINPKNMEEGITVFIMGHVCGDGVLSPSDGGIF